MSFVKLLKLISWQPQHSYNSVLSVNVRKLIWEVKIGPYCRKIIQVSIHFIIDRFFFNSSVFCTSPALQILSVSLYWRRYQLEHTSPLRYQYIHCCLLLCIMMVNNRWADIRYYGGSLARTLPELSDLDKYLRGRCMHRSMHNFLWRWRGGGVGDSGLRRCCTLA